MNTYLHHVKYYETDKMGITHHSNYIRWMEEARIDFLEKLGWGYDKMEAQGMISPVTAVNCEYRKSTTFNDVVEIKVTVKEYKGVRFTIGYEMRNVKTDDIVLTGSTQHCFIHEDGSLIRLKKEYPEFDQVLRKLMEENSEI